MIDAQQDFITVLISKAFGIKNEAELVEAIKQTHGGAAAFKSGRTEGVFDTLFGLLKDKFLSLTEVSKRLNMPEEQTKREYENWIKKYAA